ncbi:LapA family protein [Roseobacter sp. HKCCA0434]|uniref:LapA family protein n=1 Tax=Roseobacter sp. HKCCA0434 TaxID=3079297 RepID=UPI002905AD65|nr:LapA family protein [Roseobacter sp. HKCCA0434]
MRFVKLVLLVLLAIIVILLAIANGQLVTVQLMPSQFAFLTDWSIQMPLFVVMIGMATAGFVIGYFLEYLREYRVRAIARRRKREIGKLEREVSTLRSETGREEDEVLALLK